METEAIYLPGAASLAEQLDDRIMLILRDGRTLVGTLRSFDQYMNLVLESTIERVVYGNKFCDIPLGLFLVRGDNLVLMGEVDPNKDSEESMQEVTAAELAELVAGGEGPKLEWDFE